MIDNADERAHRQFWLLLIGLAVAIVLLIFKFPRTSAAIIAALVGAGALVRFGIV